MSQTFDFQKRFGKKIDTGDSRKDFVNKINIFLLKPTDDFIGRTYSNTPTDGRKLFRYLCLELVLNPDDVLKEYNRDPYAHDIYIPKLRYFTNDDFETTLLLVEIIYCFFINSDIYDKNDRLEFIQDSVAAALKQDNDLGVAFRNGKFYPSGAGELSDALIDKPYHWLNNYPKAKALYDNSLNCYSESLKKEIKRKDTISNAFQAVEELTKEVLGNITLSFDRNLDKLVEKLDLNKKWSQVFHQYKELSKEYGRHPGKADDFIPNKYDTEAFLFLSGIIIRLIVSKLEEEK